MNRQSASKWDHQLAKICLNCLVCRQARRKQQGIAFWMVRRVESRLCSFCRAYERVYGRKAHERPQPGFSEPAQ
ncbi:conserved hypothetical protein [Verrucomicrobia bacterium]|nr:conserved hypothetical protein [Verrucomicrobiota bacterium]